MSSASLLGISDLHVTHPENRRVVQALRPVCEDDWLVVCGDVSDELEDVEWALGLLVDRFAKVLWAPGNHELWSTPGEQGGLRGVARYARLIEICRDLGVLSPEDPYLVWEGPGEPVTVAPMFLLYDYSFGRNVAATKEQALALAHEVGVVCSDEYLLHPDPYSTREQWCCARVSATERRLQARNLELPTVLVNHFPLIEAPTRVLRHPEFAQWCGTRLTADWHRRFEAAVVVYGHLHIPRTTWDGNVRFEEVSLGYPREWHRRGSAREPLRRIWPKSGDGS